MCQKTRSQPVPSPPALRHTRCVPQNKGVSYHEAMAQETMVTIISDPAERSPSAKEACLVVIYGHELGKKYHLDQTTISIGRSSKSDIQIDQESVSRNHAQIVNDGHTVIVSDLGSTNGTYVHDVLIKQKSLRDGD